MNPINEELLQHIFDVKLYSATNLQTTAGEALRIVKNGLRNRNSGPDFLQSIIQIDDILLAGNIELHLRSSEWNRHAHSLDKAYDNVILHVVYEHDEDIYLHGKALPTLELKGRIFEHVYTTFEYLQQAKSIFACERSMATVPVIIQQSALDAALSARYERKCEALHQSMQRNQNQLEEAFYQLLGSSFGFGVNKHSFRKLCERTPLSIVKKHASSLFQLEALLFGQAGFLNESFNHYQASLKKEYDFLCAKYGLPAAMQKHEWHFSKMHPMNFPTIRMAQFASLMHHDAHLFARVKAMEQLHELEELFSVSTSPFWETYYTFEKESSAKGKHLGKSSIQILLINAVCVLLYQLGDEQELYRLRAERLLQEMKAEDNHLTKAFAKSGLHIASSFDSQAVLELHEQLCTHKLCMNCKIGAWLLRG